MMVKANDEELKSDFLDSIVNYIDSKDIIPVLETNDILLNTSLSYKIEFINKWKSNKHYKYYLLHRLNKEKEVLKSI